jgi:SSS family solute:Na+ symporter
VNAFGWCLVVGINGAIIAFGLWKSRETNRAVDWMLAARGLPWWMVGLSMFATAVDSGDYVAVAGAAYQNGMNFITDWWLGITIGWFLVAWAVFLPMYRSGMFTNAEYLERRFDPGARVIAVIVQVLYRTNVLGNVAYSLYLTFSLLTGWGDATWYLVVAIAAGAAAYTAMGGLKSVVLTDSIQSVVMLAAAVVMWVVVYQAVGGFAGMEKTMVEANVSERVRGAMTHVGKHLEEGVPAWLVIVGWIITLTAYCVVNHSQSMRMLAARSEWDVKMAAVVAAAVTAGVMWFNVTLGILGRGVRPNLPAERADDIFPILISEHLVPLGGGLAGIVVAGLLAGGISTFDSIGSSLSVVFTRDLYARFLVRNANDYHYLRVSRITTFVVIGASFAYVPFLKIGMVKFYLEMISVTVLPLMTVYLAGIFTPAHRKSGLVGLAFGCSCGLARFLCEMSDHAFPVWWSNKWYGFLWSIGATALGVLLTTLVLGRARREELQGLVVWLPATAGEGPVPVGEIEASGEMRSERQADEGNWLEKTRRELIELPRHPFDDARTRLPLRKQPWLWATIVLGILAYLNLVVLW